MAKRHTHHARIVTKFVRIPGELPEGKVRCNGCGAVVGVTKNGRTRVHRTPAGEPCAYVVSGYAEPVHLDAIPDVVLPRTKPRQREERDQSSPTGSRLDFGSNCQDCGRWLPGERSLCGQCAIRHEEDRRR